MTKRKEKLPGDRFEFTAQWLEGVQAAVYREKIDAKTGKSVKRAEARDEYRDDQVPHLRLAVTEARKRHFVLYRRYKKGGAPRRDILGTYPALSLNGAREKARAWNTLADQGIDPREEEARIAAEAAAEKRRIARENSALVPFAKVAEDFIADMEGKRRARDEAEIRRHLIPRLGEYPITKINSGHLILLGNALQETEGHRQTAGEPCQADFELRAAPVRRRRRWRAHQSLRAGGGPVRWREAKEAVRPEGAARPHS